MMDQNMAHVTNPSAILLTGATGYIGAFLLEQLLRDTQAEVYCLIRASNADDGLERILNNLRLYRIPVDAASSRIHPIVGDLTQPLLGLSSSEFAKLAATIDSIYHCGATVNFAYPYAALKGSNVLGTQEIIRLACQVKPKAVHYMSTVDVFYGALLPRPFLEVDLPERPEHPPDGYALSKWMGERLIVTARSRGVPVCIYRPPWIMGHTQTGASQTNNFLIRALKGFLQLGILPENALIFDPVPVDFVAQAVVYLSRRPESLGKIFHFVNPDPVPYRLVYDWLRSFGYEFDLVPIHVARSRAMRVDASHLLYPILGDLFPRGHEDLMAVPDPDDLRRDPPTECVNTLTSLSGSGIECPPFDQNLTHLMLAYLVSVQFLDAPDSFRANATEGESRLHLSAYPS